MDPMTLEELGEPRIVDGDAIKLAGISAEYTQETMEQIPRQWDGLNVELDRRGTFPVATYGIVYRTNPMRYVCGLEALKLDTLPEGWVDVEVPAQRNAVFAHDGGVEAIRSMWMGLWANWVPANPGRLSDGPMVEFYAEKFGMGNDHFEIWLPLKT